MRSQVKINFPFKFAYKYRYFFHDMAQYLLKNYLRFLINIFRLFLVINLRKTNLLIELMCNPIILCKFVK